MNMHLGPNQAISNRMLEILKDPKTKSRTPDEWAKMRSRAFQDNNLVEATAITCAQYVCLSGSIGPVDERVLELLAAPGMLSWTDEKWRDLRSAAWTQNNIKEAAALTYACYLVNYRQQRHHIPGHRGYHEEQEQHYTRN